MYDSLVERCNGRRPVERPIHRWDDNVKMDLKKWNREAWSGLVWLRMGTGGRCL
jgi:hypothetical protein